MPGCRFWYSSIVFATVSNLIGGIGLFLLGMSLLGEGLKSFAGDSLRTALISFTSRPVTAFLSGMFATSLVQSSSATTLMTIGFVSAGLLPFSQSVGVLIGASLGTTSTGWIVSLLGLKVSISGYALLLLAAGASCRLFLRGSLSALGTAVAGFGLVFLGIELLKTGMDGLTAFIDFSSLPDHSLSSHLLVALLGVGLTVLMQSSSAAMATTLTALNAGAISFEQAASLSIGAATGTTVTAVIACIGAGVHAKRTALAHILFNSATGLIALLLMPVLLHFITYLQEQVDLPPGAVSLALFHSLFIAIGVVIFLPILGKFSSAVEKMVPDLSPSFTSYFDKSLLGIPAVALEALRRSLLECRSALAASIAARLSGTHPRGKTSADVPMQVTIALDSARSYLSGIRIAADDAASENQRINAIHIMDHLQRLAVAIDARNIRTDSPALVSWEQRLLEILRSLISENANKSGDAAGEDVCAFSSELAGWRRERRATILEEAARPGADTSELLGELETVQWLDQIAYHLCRIQFHFSNLPGAAQTARLPAEN